MRLRDRLREPVGVQQPVGQARQRVVVGERADLLFLLLARGHVEGGAERGRLAAQVDRAGPELDPALRAVLAHDLELVGAGQLRAVLPREAALADEVAEVRMDGVPEIAAKQLVARVAGQLLGEGVRVDDARALVHEDGAGRRVGERPEARLALLERVLRVAPVERRRHLVRDERQQVALRGAVPGLRAAAPHGDDAERLVAALQRGADPVADGSRSGLELAGLDQAVPRLDVDEERLARPQDPLDQAPAGLARHRRRPAALVHEVRKGEQVRLRVVQGDREAAHVEQLGQGLADAAVQLGGTLRGALELRQPVERRLQLLVALALGHVADHDLNGRLVVEAEGDGAHLGVQDAAVAAQELLLHERQRAALGDAPGGQQLAHALGHHRPRVGVHELHHRATGHLVGPVVAEQTRARAVAVGQPARAVDRDRVRRQLDQPAVALLALAQRVLGPLALGDVAHHADDADDLARRGPPRRVVRDHPGVAAGRLHVHRDVGRVHGLAGERLAQQRLDSERARLGEELRGALADDVGGRAAGERLHERVEEDVAQVAVVDHDADVGVGDDLVRELLAERLFGAIAIGHVAAGFRASRGHVVHTRTRV